MFIYHEDDTELSDILDVAAKNACDHLDVYFPGYDNGGISSDDLIAIRETILGRLIGANKVVTTERLMTRRDFGQSGYVAEFHLIPEGANLSEDVANQIRLLLSGISQYLYPDTPQNLRSSLNISDVWKDADSAAKSAVAFANLRKIPADAFVACCRVRGVMSAAGGYVLV